MIAIDTFLQPRVGHESKAEQNFIKFCRSTHPKIVDFYWHCVHQNLILNRFYWQPVDWNHPVHPCMQSLIRYYAIDMAKAQQFQLLHDDLSAEFSLKKFWMQNQFDITCELKAVDFDGETPQYEVVDTNKKVFWGIQFPISVGSRDGSSWFDLNPLAELMLKKPNPWLLGND